MHLKSPIPGRKPTALSVRLADTPAYNGHGHLQAILDTAVEGIIVITERGLITTFNRAAARMFGYESSEALGRNVGILMPQPCHAEHGRNIASFLSTGRARIVGMGRELIGLRKDGSTFPIEVAVSDVSHDGHRSFTGIIRDISSRKRLERAILDVSDREQRRIAKDLHDGLCQELAGIALLTTTIHHQIQAGKEVPRQAAHDVAVLLKGALEHARALARGLQPVVALPNGLSVALRHLAADTAHLYSMRCQFRSPRQVEIADPQTATHFYRIAQECVRDAVCFAKAAQIVITLSRTKGGNQLTVSDNASRTSPDDVFGGDMVHEMIHHLAHMIDGRIIIRARRGGGIRVTCLAPQSKRA